MNCYQIKMIVFMDWLLQDSTPPVPQPENWEDIYSEYISLRENKSALFIMSLVKEIAFLKAKYNIVEQCCKLLSICFDNALISETEVLKDTLRRENYRFPFDLKDAAGFSSNIRAVLSANKKKITTWQRKEQDLKAYQDKHAGKAWDRKTFYVWAVTLGEKRGTRVDLETITVAEWCIMMNQYEKYCEVVNAQQKGKTYGKSR